MTIDEFIHQFETLDDEGIWRLSALAVSIAGLRAQGAGHCDIELVCENFVRDMSKITDVPPMQYELPLFNQRKV